MCVLETKRKILYYIIFILDSIYSLYLLEAM